LDRTENSQQLAARLAAAEELAQRGAIAPAAPPSFQAHVSLGSVSHACTAGLADGDQRSQRLPSPRQPAKLIHCRTQVQAPRRLHEPDRRGRSLLGDRRVACTTGVAAAVRIGQSSLPRTSSKPPAGKLAQSFDRTEARYRSGERLTGQTRTVRAGRHVLWTYRLQWQRRNMQRGDSSRPAVARQSTGTSPRTPVCVLLRDLCERAAVLPAGDWCRSVTLTPPAGPRHIAAPRARVLLLSYQAGSLAPRYAWHAQTHCRYRS
jgi:hypothetical protein